MPRTKYEMSQEDLDGILDSCKPVPAMMIGGYTPSSPQENANAAWSELGKRMGFDSMTVKPISGKGTRFFTAVPNEPNDVREARDLREFIEKNAIEIKTLEDEISGIEARLATLRETETTA